MIKTKLVTKSTLTFSVKIYVAGDLAIIKQICREYCEVGFCVTITPIDFIYTRGEESGVCIGIVNYPRFPASEKQLLKHAIVLAKKIIRNAYQWTALVETPRKTFWLTTRK